VTCAKVYTLAEARLVCGGVSERTMRADAQAGRLDTIRGPRNQLLVTATALATYRRRRRPDDLTPAAFAERAGVSLRTVRQWLADDRVPVVSISPRRTVIPWSEARQQLIAGVGRRTTLPAWVTVTDAARYLGTTRSWVWAQIRKREDATPPLPIRWRGRQRLLPRREVIGFKAVLAGEPEKW